MEDIRRRKGKVNLGKSEVETKDERLWILRNKLRVMEGRGEGGWVSLVVDIEAGTYCMEHLVRCISNESWNTEKKKRIRQMTLL